MSVTYEQRRDLLRDAHQTILAALLAEAENRDTTSMDTLHRSFSAERYAMLRTANEFAQAHRLPGRVTVADVARVETRALGHSDYATKFALYVAEELFR